MIDVKKLITGFLILAVAAGAAALIVGTVGNASTQNNTAIVAVAATPAPTIGSDAFLPPIADQNSELNNPSDNTDGDTSDSSTDAILNNPNNLTNQLAETYITNLMDANPGGAQESNTGEAALVAPDDTTILNQFATTSTINSVDPPDWDVEADQIPITINETSSPSALADYNTAVQDIFNQDFVQPNLESMINQNADPSAATFVEPKLQSAIQDLAGLDTPKPAVAFEKSLITVLVYAKNTLALTQNDTADPVKTALIFQAESPKYDQAVQNFETQLQALSAMKGFAPVAEIPAQTGPVAFIDTMLGIKTAHAFLGIGDITFDMTNFVQILKEYAENIILQITKNIVIGLIQKTALKWVQGNGVPKFIQNWGTVLVTAYTNAAANELSSQMQCVNPAYRSQLQVLLKIPTPTAASGVCAAQFSSVLAGSNLTSFYKNFSNGGFVSYMAIFKPSGNLFGSAMDAQDDAMNTGLQQYASVQTKSIANQGWTGKDICLSPTGGQALNPDTGCNIGDNLNSAGECVAANGGKTYDPVDVTGDGDGGCPDGYDPTTLQPGQVTGQVFNSAIDDSGKLTAGANDIAGLLDSVLSSLLNSIATDVITTASGAVNSIGNGGGSGGTTSNNPNGSTSVTLQCTVTAAGSVGGFVFTASGGNVISSNGTQTTPAYTWNAPLGATPLSGTGPTFQTQFNATGTYNVVLTDTVDRVSTNCPATY